MFAASELSKEQVQIYLIRRKALTGSQ